MTPLYLTEFPDFDAHDDIAALLAHGFKDVSYRNDSCPCLALGPDGAETLYVFVDYLDPSKVNYPEGVSLLRFGIVQPETAGQFGDNDLSAEFRTLQEVLDGLA